MKRILPVDLLALSVTGRERVWAGEGRGGDVVVPLSASSAPVRAGVSFS